MKEMFAIYVRATNKDGNGTSEEEFVGYENYPTEDEIKKAMLCVFDEGRIVLHARVEKRYCGKFVTKNGITIVE